MPIVFTAGTNFWHVANMTGQEAPTWFFTARTRTLTPGIAWGFTGDFNRDGRADALVAGSASASGPAVEQILSSGSGGTYSASQIPSLTSLPQNFGESMAVAGDVNGDGYLDAIVGGSGTSAGAALYLGGSTGLRSFIRINPPAPDPGFGAAVASAGDFDHDGYADFAVASTSGSLIRIYYGRATGFHVEPVSVVCRPGSALIRLLGALDLDGDGYGDLAIGTPRGVCLVFGGPRGCTRIQQLRVPSGMSERELVSFGPWMTAGDFSRNGRSELLVSLRDDTTGTPSLIYYPEYRSEGIRITVPPRTSSTSTMVLGTVVERIGDMNADGSDELAVAYPDSREVVVYALESSALAGLGTVVIRLPDTPRTLSGIGDQDNNGFPDMVVGSPDSNRVVLINSMGMGRFTTNPIIPVDGITGFGAFLGR